MKFKNTIFYKYFFLYFLVNKKNIDRSLILTFLFCLFIFFLFKIGILHKYIIIPFKINDEIIIFRDAKLLAKWIQCSSQGADVLKLNSCENVNVMTYGLLVKYLPYNSFLEYLYIYFLPSLCILMIIFFHFYLNNTKNFFQFFLVVIALFNQHTLLMFDRGNSENIIYIILLYACYTQKDFIKGLFITIFTLIKYYPILLFQTFFLKENNVFNKFFLFFVVVILIFLFFNFQEILYILRNNLYGATIRYNFSFWANARYFDKLFNYYQVGLILSIIISCISFFISFKVINSKDLRLINYKTYNEKIFLISLNLVTCIYLFFSNYYYKDFYLMLLLPLIFDQKLGIRYSKILSYLMFFRYSFVFLSNNFIIWRKDYNLLLIQNLLDNILIAFLFPIFLYLNLKFLNDLRFNFFNSIKR